MSNLETHRLVVGVGNPDRGDDAAGRRVAQLLRKQRSGEVEIEELDGEPTALLSRLERARAAWIIDACRTGAATGTVHRFDVSALPLPQVCLGLSTHGMGLAEALGLARALGQLPARCIVYGIEAGQFHAGAGLSAAVAGSVPVVAARVIAEVLGTTPHAARRTEA
jgi:hydrogenase maturation protease